MSNVYTRSFSVREMACKCDRCKHDYDAKMNTAFMLKLQKVRDLMADPMIPTSAYRCPEHNEDVGGVKNSFHTQGRAVDIACTDSKYRARLLQYAIKAGLYGIGIAKDFIHLDDRPFSKFKIWVYYD